jgi:hypothetical protein
MISWRWIVGDGPAVVISPPSGPRANAVITRSILPASRTPIGLNSIPSGAAAAWITPNWAAPAAIETSRNTPTRDAHARHPRRDLPEQLQPFPAHGVFELTESGGVTARPCKIFDETGSDRIGDPNEHDRHGTGRLQQRTCRRTAGGENDVRRQRHKLDRVSAGIVRFAQSPAVLDSQVITFAPPQFL